MNDVTTTETAETQLKTFFFTIAPRGEVKVGETKGGKPFASFGGDLSSRKTKRTAPVTVFNTKRHPNLVERVVAAIQSGPARLVVTFDKVEGKKRETVRVLGFAPEQGKKAA